MSGRAPGETCLETQAKILAVIDAEGNLDATASRRDKIQPSTALVALGTGEQIACLERFLRTEDL